ncbi:hypothetical protein ASPFODRAFT_210678 [Aspergillus luchuensis CBS 106.47]|uniref:Uncharacterized protein n=1 Tax=Aspergillus luchuensis (strain CBS 106.47) TaxID=1137211 RepID=A0A1M3T7W1_ASPLC|nr:hypothetical protein ASPFODRAFT_210678 [Aspergillus luchuensis CBS 106.47]
MNNEGPGFIESPLPLVTDRRPQPNMADLGYDSLSPLVNGEARNSDTMERPDDMGAQRSSGMGNMSTAPEPRANFDAHEGMNLQLLDTGAEFPAQMCDARPIDNLNDNNVRDFSSKGETSETL